MIVNDKKIHSLIEMIDSRAYCNDVYFNWFGKHCKDNKNAGIGIVECNEKCPFYNAENMMKWLKEGK